jgi:HAD superfamily phosphoserine phosphatase-like hydrolase
LSDLPSEQARGFVESVLRLRPQTAAFDCDGTLWRGDAGERFFDWELRQDFLSPENIHWARARYSDYKKGIVPEEVMCGEMVTLHKGLKEDFVEQQAQRFFDGPFSKGIFPEMQNLVRQLQESGCQVWAVSSSNEWLIRIAMGHFGIPRAHIRAALGEVQEGVITGRLLRVPSGHGKVLALTEAVEGEVDAAFGNSKWDTEMLSFARHPFAVNPNPDLERTAKERGWRIYYPDGVEQTV